MRRASSVWRNLIHRNRIERDLDDEIRTVFDLLVEEKMRAGASSADARRAATLELGRVESVKDQVRDVRAGALAESFLQDLRYAARLLRRNPLFTLTVALSLAIGIGANTTIFTIANALLFRAPSGVNAADRLLDIYRAEEGRAMANFTTSYPYYRDVRQRTTTLAGLYAYEFEPQPVSFGAAAGTDLAFANAVTANYFAELGVLPAAGRLFSADDSEEAGASPIAVLSHRFWQRRFNGNAALVGQTVYINRHPFTVVGVAGEGFRGTNVVSSDLWVPMGMVGAVQPGSARLTSRQDGLGMGGRLKPGVSIAQARAELDAIARAIEHENPFVERGTRLRVARLSSIPGPIATVAAGFFALLLALVSVVLVVACANVAGVLLARAAARRREIAVRIAIGAGRARVIRQVLTETMVLFLLGGAAGLLLARAMTSLLISALPAIPVLIDVSLPLDGRVIVFTTGLSLVAALLSGLAPALHVSKTDVYGGLKDESHAPPERLRMRSVFVIAQVACSIMLVVVAGLLVRALGRFSSIDRGFDPHGVEVASLDLSRAGYTTSTGAVFARDLMDRIRLLPGVETATLADLPPGRGGSLVRLTVPGVTPPEGQPFFMGFSSSVDSDYFKTLRIPLLAGRDFIGADRAGAEPVAIVSETTARFFWPGQDAVGKFVAWHEGTSEQPGSISSVRVIGVARDVKTPGGTQMRELRTRPGPGKPGVRQNQLPPPQTFSSPVSLTLYVPLRQRYPPQLTLMVRTVGGRRMASEIRELVRSMDASLPMLAPQTLDSQGGPAYLQLRVAASVAGSVGTVGLLLAAIGIYGVTAYTTTRRTREIGIRIAMGAQRRDVVGMVMRQGMVLVAIGSAIGLLLGAAGSRLFGRLLQGVPATDPIILGGAALLFAAIGLAASYLPALRATRIDAMEALRYE